MCVRSGPVSAGGGGWLGGKLQRTQNTFSISYVLADDSFALKSWKCFSGARVSLAGANGRTVGGWCRRKIYDMCATASCTYNNTHLSPIFAKNRGNFTRDCVGLACLVGEKKRTEKFVSMPFIRARIRSMFDSVTLV